MEQIDWSKAPEGATHYLPRGVAGNNACWYIIRDNDMAVMRASVDNDGWKWRPIDRYDRKHFIPAAIPRPTTWNGKGLPPVGTVCEYDAAAQGQPPYWHTVEVVYASEWVIVVRCLQNPDEATDVVGVENAVDATEEAKSLFRPIRTPEQIAAEEREKAVHAMWLCICEETPQRTALIKQACADLYDAGYRKVDPAK